MKKEKNIIKVQRYESPCGLLLLGSFGDKLCSVSYTHLTLPTSDLV